MLIAEEFLLLSLDDETGRKLIGSEKLEPALGAALLVELALMERIAITDDGWGKRGRVTVTFTTPTDDPVLDDALTYLEANEGKKVVNLIAPTSWRPMTKDLRPRLLTRLAAAGVLTEHRGKALGVFPHTTWRTADGTVEARIRARLRGALVDGSTPTERTAALIALLHVTKQVARAFPGENKRTVVRRAKELAEGDWAAKAVKAAIDAASAAVAGGAGGDG